MERQGGLTYLREHYRLNPSELYVVNILVRFNQGGACFPTQDKIAWESGLPLRNVKRALDSLAAKGVVTREKQPYYDKRGRLRAGKIHHYFLSGAVSFAVKVGHPHDAPPMPDGGQNGTNLALELPAAAVLPDKGQNGTNLAAEQPEQEPLLPDRGRNGTNVATEPPQTAVLPDRCQNGTLFGAKMAPTECQNGTNEGAKMAPHKEVIEGLIEGEGEKKGDPATATGAHDALSSPKQLFNRLIRDKSLVPAHRYNDLLGQVRAEIDPLPSRASKDEQVLAWADRILAGEFADAAAHALAAD